MSDHTYPIMEALGSALDDLNDPDWHINHLLWVDNEIVSDYLVAVNGPTRWFRVVSYTADQGGGVKRVEYHDSWSSGAESVMLTDDEAQRVLDVLGLDWG